MKLKVKVLVLAKMALPEKVTASYIAILPVPVRVSDAVEATASWYKLIAKPEPITGILGPLLIIAISVGALG